MEKDFIKCFKNDLKFSDHINEICQKGFQRISFYFVAFTCMYVPCSIYKCDTPSFRELYTKRMVKRSKEGQLS